MQKTNKVDQAAMLKVMLWWSLRSARGAKTISFLRKKTPLCIQIYRDMCKKGKAKCSIEISKGDMVKLERQATTTLLRRKKVKLRFFFQDQSARGWTKYWSSFIAFTHSWMERDWHRTTPLTSSWLPQQVTEHNNHYRFSTFMIILNPEDLFFVWELNDFVIVRTKLYYISNRG